MIFRFFLNYDQNVQGDEKYKYFFQHFPDVYISVFQKILDNHLSIGNDNKTEDYKKQEKLNQEAQDQLDNIKKENLELEHQIVNYRQHKEDISIAKQQNEAERQKYEEQVNDIQSQIDQIQKQIQQVTTEISSIN